MSEKTLGQIAWEKYMVVDGRLWEEASELEQAQWKGIAAAVEAEVKQRITERLMAEHEDHRNSDCSNYRLGVMASTCIVQEMMKPTGPNIDRKALALEAVLIFNKHPFCAEERARWIYISASLGMPQRRNILNQDDGYDCTTRMLLAIVRKALENE